MNTYKLTLEISDPYSFFDSKEKVEIAVRDLLVSGVLPALNLELDDIAITKKRG
jgi:hypothetical protein